MAYKKRLEPFLSGFESRAVEWLGSVHIWLRLGLRAVSSRAVAALPVTWTVDSYILIRQRLDDPYHVTTVKKSYQAHLHGAPTVQYDIVFPARFGAMQLSIVLAVLGRCDRSSGTEWQYICQGYWRS